MRNEFVFHCSQVGSLAHAYAHTHAYAYLIHSLIYASSATDTDTALVNGWRHRASQ